MILAVADYANGETKQQPPILKTAFLCERWHCLPSDLQRQPFGIMEQMTLALNVYRAFEGFNNAKNAAEWAKKHPEQEDLIQRVTELRRNHG